MAANELPIPRRVFGRYLATHSPALGSHRRIAKRSRLRRQQIEPLAQQTHAVARSLDRLAQVVSKAQRAVK